MGDFCNRHSAVEKQIFREVQPLIENVMVWWNRERLREGAYKMVGR